jgi:hypothetical protein
MNLKAPWSAIRTASGSAIRKSGLKIGPQFNAVLGLILGLPRVDVVADPMADLLKVAQERERVNPPHGQDSDFRFLVCLFLACESFLVPTSPGLLASFACDTDMPLFHG